VAGFRVHLQRGYCEIAGKKYIDGGLVDPQPVKRVYGWGYRNII